MTRTNRQTWAVVLAIALAGAILSLSPACMAAGASSQDPATAVKAKLHGSHYKNVRVSVNQNGVATLSGTVDLYDYKQAAGKIAHKVKSVKAVQNDIQVGGPNLSDAQIENKLGPELAYSRQGYGIVFDAIQLQVRNGVVTLGGHVHNYPNRDAAIALASTTPGVKDVIDNMQVDPVSQMDWGIRMAMQRAIYGDMALQKYAIDPERPIRISVQNGHVELYGTVASEMDRNLVNMRAQTVPGVFSVKNYVQVEGQPSTQEK